MTLEDFFTLTEMRDGLTAPSRVQELVSVMQKEQDSVVKNACDATRQWAAVASTIAATENKDCLDLFIQLDGLLFINRWLNESQNFGADANDEESISALLRAIEKLQLDSKKSISSGIRGTVHKLLGHHSSKVQDRARQLFDIWEGGENGEAEPQVDSSGDKIVKQESQPSALTEGGNVGHASEIVVGEKSQLRRSDSTPPEKVSLEQIKSSDNAPESSVSLDCDDPKEKSNHFSNVLTSGQEVAPVSEGVATLTETCNAPIPKPGNFKGEPDGVELNDLSKEEKQEQNSNGPPENPGIPDSTLPSSKLGHGPVSVGATETNAPESVKEPTLEHNDGNNENGVSHKMTVSCDMKTAASDAKSGVDDVEAINSSNPQPPKASENDNECVSNVLQDSLVSDRNVGKSEQLEMPFVKTEYVKGVTECKGQVSHQGNDASSYGSEREYGIVDNNALKVARQVSLEKGQVSNKVIDASNGSDSSRRRKRRKIPNIIKKTSDIELEYGIVDALEVARQVAQEVEREVRSSSSEKISEDRQSDSSDSLVSSETKYELTHVLPEEVSSRHSNSANACSEQEGHMSYSDNIEAQAQPECLPDLESSQVTEAARDPGGNLEKSLCTFDLNEEIGSNGMDMSVNALPAAPIPIVSTSKPAQSSGLPTAPLQFEGTLGWKGSAVTSAFRPASPRRSSDSEKNVSVGGNSDSSKLRHDFLDIDLNMTDGNQELVKQKTSGLLFEQSSAELNPKQSSRLDLDLNSVGDDGGNQPSNCRMDAQLFSQRNGFWSPLQGSSSSSMQPSVRNIDLNDRPYFQTELVEQGPSKSYIMDSYGRSKSDAPVISILGAKVEVDKRDHAPQTLSFPNGKAVEPVIDLTMSGAGAMLGMSPSVSYNNSAVFGYNGLSSGPHLSFSSAIYGSGGTIPYMVDSRGAPVVPQVGGSSSTILSPYTQPPVVMNMAGTQLSLNGVGPSAPNFDLNSGFMIDGGPRDTLAARQFFFPSSGRALEDHVRTTPQSSSSGVGGKRKEPDSGWDPYPFTYKGPQPPWK